jgi:hypothetical protein
VAKFVDFYLKKAHELAPRVGYVAVTDEIAKTSREIFDGALKSAGAVAKN